ncbi:DUF5011 domain-containing protein [Neobacillus drentensis]|uniref:DUF5011 domain-containing protein n=1 Tax=Neobacillus drentensis TaxID=220684 RepID=UPI002FFDF09B
MRKVISYLLIFILFASLLPISTSAEALPENAILYIPNDENMLVGTIDYEGQVNTYEITPEATGDLVMYQANALRIWAVLYDENMKLLDVIRDPSVFKVEKGHKYYLRVQMLLNIPEKTGEYQLKVILPTDTPDWNSNYEPNDSLGLAYPLPSAQTISSAIEYSSDRDFYKIEVSQAGQILAIVKGKNFNMRVFDEGGKNLNWIASSEAYGQSFRQWVTPGTYYLSIGPINGYRGTYDFQITYPNNHEVIQDSFGEPNNVLQEAMLLETDQTYQFKFENESDIDWYKFVLTEPQRIAIEGVQDQLGIGTIWGYNDQGAGVSGFSQFTDIQPNYFHQLTEVLPAGTSYLLVYRVNKSIKIGNYSLKLTKVPADDVTNTNSMRLPLDQSFTGKIDYSWDTDPFVYWDTQYDGNLQFRVHSTFPAGLEVSYDYGTKAPPVVTKDGEDTLYTFNVKKGTTYYINVYSPSGVYGDATTYTLTATHKTDPIPGPVSVPVITGVSDKSTPISTDFDPLLGVKATDSVDGDITASIRISGVVNVNAAGTYWLTYTVKNSSGKETSVTRKVMVYDNVKPVFEGVEDIAIPIGTVFDPLSGVKATDNADGDLTIAIEIFGAVNGDTKGIYVLTYEVVDTSGNRTTVERKVTIYDNESPWFEGITNQWIQIGTAFDPLDGVKATDTVDGDLTSSIHISGSVDSNTKGIYELTYTVKDSSGNAISATRQITVSDRVKPVLKGVTDKTINIHSAFDPLAGVAANDIPDGDLTKLIQVSGSVDVHMKGIYWLTYTVRDSSRNETTATRKITVVDQVKPVFKGITDKAIPINTAFNPRAGVGAIDNVDGDITGSIRISGWVNVKAKGTYWLTYLVKDSSGNETTATRKITVNDHVKPVLKGITNQTININYTFNPRAGVSATDNVDGNLTKNINIKGAVNAKVKGVYVLTYSVVDKSGNTSTITRKITVKDNIKPVIYGVKSKTIKRYLSFNPRTGVLAKDNSDGNLTKKIQISGSVNTRKKGKYTLTYYVFDQSGNKTTIKRKITVK